MQLRLEGEHQQHETSFSMTGMPAHTHTINMGLLNDQQQQQQHHEDRHSNNNAALRSYIMMEEKEDPPSSLKRTTDHHHHHHQQDHMLDARNNKRAKSASDYHGTQQGPGQLPHNSQQGNMFVS